MIEPPPCFCITGMTCFMARIGALEIDREDVVPARLRRPRRRCPSRRCRHCCRARRCGHRPSGTPPTIASTSAGARDVGGECGRLAALARDDARRSLRAAAALRSTQNTCAPSRAKVTAVALPLPQPGPIEPAPTTIADFALEPIHTTSPGFCCYRSHALMVVTLAPTGCPKISDSVRQLPSWHNRHSPAAPELPSTTSGIGGRFGCH